MTFSDGDVPTSVETSPNNRIWRARNFKTPVETLRDTGETEYAAGTWDRPRRVIMKAERLEAGPNRRFIVTSLTGDPQQLYDATYVQRGDMENRIKEQQLMLFADRTSCHDFVADQFRLLLSNVAYVLLHELRESHLVNTELELTTPQLLYQSE